MCTQQVTEVSDEVMRIFAEIQVQRFKRELKNSRHRFGSPSKVFPLGYFGTYQIPLRGRGADTVYAYWDVFSDGRTQRRLPLEREIFCSK